MKRQRWIVIPNWERFQHYRDRTPIWIKTYLELIPDDAYRGLPLATRGLLHDLWLLYASSRGIVRADPKQLSSLIGATVKHAQLERLNHAGFIRLVASKPLALRYQVASPRALARGRGEKEKEEEPDSGSLALTSSRSPESPEPNGPSPTKPTYDVIKAFITNAAGEYTDTSILDEIALQERRRKDTVTDTQKTELLELAHTLRGENEGAP